jgi:hypothetical protein
MDMQLCNLLCIFGSALMGVASSFSSSLYMISFQASNGREAVFPLFLLQHLVISTKTFCHTTVRNYHIHPNTR